MSKELSESISRLKMDSSKANKTKFITNLISNKFFVPVIVKADENKNITEMGYYSIHTEGGSYLLVFTSIEAIGAWRKDVQFLELGYNDIWGIVNVENSGYVGIEIDRGGESMALRKDFINKVKSHIKDKK